MFGSNLYNLKLWLMTKPRGEGLDVPVEYLVNLNPDTLEEKNVHIQVERRALLRDDDAIVDA
ncbi:hypothetical protein EYZ11_003175 [Aspergillus tanneri]|nr:hypothetical protein EYZ11_003175 [Aspergillus tanneri]